jgi:hypothetical protein
LPQRSIAPHSSLRSVSALPCSSATWLAFASQEVSLLALVNNLCP